MIKVYFQSIAGSHSELVAVFPTEEIYMACLPALRWQADKQRCFVTEIVEDDEIIPSDRQAVGYSCLKWYSEDFGGSYEKMTKFFESHNEVIVQHINELISISQDEIL